MDYQNTKLPLILNKIAQELRQQNDKWWRDPLTNECIFRNRPEMMMLMVSEIAEAMEGYRKNLQDDHLPQFPMETVEFADLFIRMMDYVGEHCPQFGEAVVAKLEYNQHRADHTNAVRLAEGGKKF
jgi:hypothetical protein